MRKYYRCAEDERTDYWQEKIKEGDPFYLAKENAIAVAVDLGYSDSTIEDILDVTRKEDDIYDVLQEARKKQMEIEKKRKEKKYAKVPLQTV